MLKIDVESLQSAVNSGVQMAIEKLQSAKISATSISVPSGFSMADAVRRIPSQIEGAIDSLLSAKNSVASATERFIGAESANANLINNIFMGFFGGGFRGLFDNLNLIIQSNDKKNLNIFNLIKASGYGHTGVDQGVFDYLLREDRVYYDELINKASRKYNMEKKDVIKLMEVLDSIGACSYAAFANGIIEKYAYNPAEFADKYGINLYRFYKNKTSGKTEVRLNDAEILLDLFIAANTDPNVGFDTNDYNEYNGTIQKYLLERTKNGELKFNEGAIRFTINGYSTVDEEVYVNQNKKSEKTYHRSFETVDIKSSGQKDNYNDIYDWQLNAGQGLKAWIDSHQEGESSNIKAEYIFPKNSNENSKFADTKINDEEMNVVKQKIKESLDNGMYVGLDIHSNQIVLRDMQGENSYVSAHAVAVTGITDTKLNVLSWGEMMEVDFKDLQNCSDWTIQLINGF